ncbi:MAG: RnfABCDGE type electron transport complex subunit C, partial [Bdellovibrionales bacterium]|nr:RnfABCDGE type electron transport complex subunit C [Bdellovibrionales bacterium]
ILMQLLNSSRAVIGIENNKRDAIKQLEQLLESESGIEVTPLKVQYPQGGEKQLINATIGKEVPAGALPIEVGAVVHNVGTIVAIYHAVMKGRPLVERIITVTGKKITKPANFRVRIGTPVSHLIEAVGGLPMGSGKVINGGPMMGRALTTLDAPVVKGSSGILVMDGSESIRREAVACIRCAKCIDSCPMGLAPYLLKIWGERSELERAEDELVMDCIECGSCSFTCPANLPLLDYIRLAKQGVGRMLRERSKS